MTRSSRTKDPAADALQDICNPALTHAIRWKTCRGLLKRRYHITESIRILEHIYGKPDGSMSADALHQVGQLILLHKPSTQAQPSKALARARTFGRAPYWPDAGSGHGAGHDMCTQHGGTLIPINLYRQLTDDERGYPIV
jgi:hypothetical protein